MKDTVEKQTTEYLNKQRQISTFLECKKTFFGKVKYYFSTRKKELKPIEKGKTKMNKSKISVQDLNLFYGNFQALYDVNLEIPANMVTAFIGPSGCGKSTLLKTFNRMNDLVVGCRTEGKVLIDDENIFENIDVNLLRKKVGMVFQKPNPFPMSIYDNIAYGPRTHGIKRKSDLDNIVEKALQDAAICSARR